MSVLCYMPDPALSLMLILILDSSQFLITFHFDWMSCVALEDEFAVEKHNGLVDG